MSREIVTGILREKLGFRGLVITDSLEMGAVTESFAPGEAVLAALNAGCDILLMPADLAEAFEAVVSAVESGVFPEEQLDEIVRRILRFKMDAGILNI
jgi:beta-N-acetylhexosaminidase